MEKFRPPRQLTATFELVTPLFLGGADHHASSLRTQSIKSELLFWWRAMTFNRLVRKQGNLPDALKHLQTAERRIFGSNDAQSMFLLQAQWIDNAGVVLDNPIVKVGGNGLKDGFAITTASGHGGDVTIEGVAYLGYGICNPNGKIEDNRSCFRAGQRFEINITFRKNCSNEDEKAIFDAFMAFGLLGSLGSRKRRGFGSLSFASMPHWSEPDNQNKDSAKKLPKDADEYIEYVQSLLPDKDAFGKDWPISAFAADTEIRLWNEGFLDAQTALNQVGLGFRRYRSWKATRQNFKTDHDWFKHNQGKWSDRKSTATSLGIDEESLPERAVFGLPHSYFSNNFSKKPNSLTVNAGSQSVERRASPLFFHIHKIGQKYFPLAIFFDNLFLPEDKLSISNKNVPYKPNSQTILDFLDGVTRSDGTPASRQAGSDPYFGNNVKIKPLCSNQT